MERAPTRQDRIQGIGLEGFLVELFKHGWVDEKFCGLKRFKVIYESHGEPNNNYIEWTAVIKERQVSSRPGLN